MSCLYILEIRPLSVASFANIFSHSVGCLFVLFMVSFAVQRLICLIRSKVFFLELKFLSYSWPGLLFWAPETMAGENSNILSQQGPVKPTCWAAWRVCIFWRQDGSSLESILRPFWPKPHWKVWLFRNCSTVVNGARFLLYTPALLRWWRGGWW